MSEWWEALFEIWEEIPKWEMITVGVLFLLIVGVMSIGWQVQDLRATLPTDQFNAAQRPWNCLTYIFGVGILVCCILLRAATNSRRRICFAGSTIS